MPRRISFTDVERYQRIDQQTVAWSMVAQSVEPKLGEWDPETRSSKQKTSAAGVLQWIVQVLFVPAEGDAAHRPEVVPVTVTMPEEPDVRRGKAIVFDDFAQFIFVKDDGRNGRDVTFGRAFSAAGFHQDGGEQ